MQYTPYTLPLLVAAAIALGLAYFAFKYRDVPGRVTFALLMVAVAVWSGGYALEISATAFATKVFWAKVQYFGIAAIPLLWLRFVIHFTGESSWMSAGRFALLAIVPAITVVLAWFNERLQLIWADITVDRSLGFAMLDFRYGSGLYAYAGYSYLLLLVGALVLFRAIVRLPRLGSRQGAVVLFAALAPWAGNVLYLTGLNPFPLLDLTPFAFTVTGLAVVWGVGRFQFMSTVPVAHRAIIEGMQAGVIALDAADNVVELNPAAERMFGVRSEAAIGKPARRVFEDRPEVIEWLTVRREMTFRGTLEADGTRRDLDVRTMLLYDRRRHAGRLITFHDISKLARAEREAEEAKEVAEAASRAKSEFLANVSHEIRTPLNAIIGMTDLTLESELEEQQRDYLEVARSSARSLLSIINDILDFSKIEVRKLELDHVPFDLHRLVEETVKMLAVTAAGKPLRLRASIDPGVLRVVAGDPLRLRQVLMNLLSNAIKFTEQGEVSVTVRCDDDELSDDRHRLLFFVRDTGIGIEAQDKQRIFESFAQADASTTRIYGGTGLGLAIASHLIHLMGGHIGVESEPGVGSTFSFSVMVEATDADAMPLHPERVAPAVLARTEVSIDRGDGDHGPSGERQVPAPGARPGDSMTPLRVLLADDNVINQRVTCALLESRGHRVRLAGDGREAVEALGEEQFDVVLMDVQMPRVDGLEATRAIRAGEQWSGRHVPIIAITAHAMAGDRERFLEAGMDAYVPKPLDAAELFDTMERVLDGGDEGRQTMAAPPSADVPRAGASARPDDDAVSVPPDGPADDTAAVAASPADSAPDTTESAVLDRVSARERVGGDDQLLVEIIDLFLQDAPRVLEKLHAAAAEGDVESVWKAAHRLKGSVSTLSAPRALAAAHDLEQAGRGGTIDHAEIGRLDNELERLERALGGLRSELTASR